jgi:hypothetical protein
MKKVEAVFRFIGCMVASYIVGALITSLLYVLFGLDDFACGLLLGGIMMGLIVYYYQRRKNKNNFVQSC